MGVERRGQEPRRRGRRGFDSNDDFEISKSFEAEEEAAAVEGDEAATEESNGRGNRGSRYRPSRPSGPRGADY